jgi:hypothetical protein
MQHATAGILPTLVTSLDVVFQVCSFVAVCRFLLICGLLLCADLLTIVSAPCLLNKTSTKGWICRMIHTINIHMD